MTNKEYIEKIVECFDVSSLYDEKEIENIIKQIRVEVIDEYKLKLLNSKTDLVNDIHKAKIWVEFKRQAIDIAEQLKENK